MGRLLMIPAVVSTIGTWLLPPDSHFNFYRLLLVLLILFCMFFDFYLIEYEYKKALKELIERQTLGYENG